MTDLERTWYNRIQWSPEDDSQRNRYPERSGPVKIAILDSGIDLQHDDFQRPAKRRSKVGIETAKQLPEEPQRTRIKAYRNFIGRPGEEDDVTDSVGHGTHLAGIIMAIAPRAHLYIAKTSTKSDQRTAKKDENLEDGVRRKVRRPIEEVRDTLMAWPRLAANLVLGAEVGDRAKCRHYQSLVRVSSGELI